MIVLHLLYELLATGALDVCVRNDTLGVGLLMLASHVVCLVSLLVVELAQLGLIMHRGVLSVLNLDIVVGSLSEQIWVQHLPIVQ